MTRVNGTDDLPVDADGVVPVRVIVEEEPKESSAYLFVRTVPDPKSGGDVKEVQRRLQTCSARKRKESCATTTTPSKKRATTSTTYTRPSNNTRILRRVARRTQATSSAKLDTRTAAGRVRYGYPRVSALTILVLGIDLHPQFFRFIYQNGFGFGADPRFPRGSPLEPRND